MVGFYFPDGNDEFEYDVRGLMTSFFPGCEPVKLAGRPDAEAALDFERILCIPAFPEIADKGERKNETKRAFYRELSEMTDGKQLPWGTLTGIRPTKLITQYLEAGHPEFDTAESKGFRSLMKEKYLISDEKLELAVRIAREEQKILSGIGPDGFPCRRVHRRDDRGDGRRLRDLCRKTAGYGLYRRRNPHGDHGRPAGQSHLGRGRAF